MGRAIMLISDNVPIGSVHCQSNSCSSKRMAKRQATAPQVEFACVDCANLLLEAHHLCGEFVAVHGLEIGEDLASKCLMVLKHVDVAKR